MSDAADAIPARLRIDADRGDPEALYRFGLALVAQHRMEQAFACHARAAAAGHVAAQIEQARMLLYGIGTDADPAHAVIGLERAEQSGSVAAGYLLALVAVGGVHLPRDLRINQRVGAAVQADYPPALRAAAIHFGRKPHAADQTLCLQLLERAAARGDAIAALLLVERLHRGEGCTPDPAFADDLREQLAANGIATGLPAVTASPPGRADSPPNTLALEETWMSPSAQVLATRPRVCVIDALLSADECRLLIACAHPALRYSQTIDPDTGEAVTRELRTSSDASFDPIVEDLALRLVQLRMAAAAGVELVQAEQLIVLRYQPGQEYRPHRDYLPPGKIEQPEAGNRVRSICTYLNQVEAGGETEFPLAAVKISPAPGRAVVFDNLLADGRPDPDSLHAGLPVERGEKWLATLWLRERRYRDY